MHSAFFRSLSGAVSIAAAVLSATCSVNAQTQPQISWCEDGSGVTPDERLRGCTAVIESGRYEGDKLSSAFSNRGLAYSSKGETDRAIQDYDQSIRLNPQNAATFNNRGNAYLNKHQSDRAIQDYDQAVRLDPKYADAFSNRGLAYAQKRQFARSIQDSEQAIRLNPQSARAFNTRGSAYIGLGEFDRAIADFDQATRLNPQYADAYGHDNRSASAHDYCAWCRYKRKCRNSLS